MIYKCVLVVCFQICSYDKEDIQHCRLYSGGQHLWCEACERSTCAEGIGSLLWLQTCYWYGGYSTLQALQWGTARVRHVRCDICVWWCDICVWWCDIWTLQALQWGTARVRHVRGASLRRGLVVCYAWSVRRITSPPTWLRGVNIL